MMGVRLPRLGEPKVLVPGFADPQTGNLLSIERQILFDSVHVDDLRLPEIRLFADFVGKTSAEISPVVAPISEPPAGCLSPPRWFEIHRLRIRAIPLHRAIASDLRRVRWDTVRAHGAARLHIGCKDAFDGPIGLLPFTFDPRPWVLQPQQSFFVELTLPERCAIHEPWKVIVYLDGYIGLETP